MFLHKQKKQRTRLDIRLFDKEDHCILQSELREFPLPEECVLAMSQEYFNDPEPCEIHRSAVRERAMMELMHFCAPGERKNIAACEEKRRNWFPAEAEEMEILEVPLP